MEIKQVYNLVNDSLKEVLGKENVLLEDLSNVVDSGEELFNAGAVDKYVKSLVNHIGKVIFVDRTYKGSAPSVLMDAWEFGSVVEKISMDLPDSEENESWELEDRTSYDTNIFYKPKVTAKFFNKKVTFEIPISITDLQVKQSFSNATQLNSFLSMIYNKVEQKMTLDLDGLVKKTIVNFIAETIYDGVGTTYTNTSTRAVNLLKLYNDSHAGNTLTQANCLESADFIKFATRIINLYKDRMSEMSSLFNMGGTAKFTPDDMLHIVMLSDFTSSAVAYLESDTYHNELVRLPRYEKVSYWQGSGENYEFSQTSKINVNTSENHTINVDGILGVMFDRDALGVSNLDRRTTSHYVEKAEFTNNWYKMDAGYFNDFNENFVVFYVK